MGDIAGAVIRLRNAECGMRNAECGMRILECGIGELVLDGGGGMGVICWDE